MEKGSRNKAIAARDTDHKSAPEAYCFPEYGITVHANSPAEAQELLNDVLASRDK